MSKDLQQAFAELVGEIAPIKKPNTSPEFGRKPVRHKRPRAPQERDDMRYRENMQLSHNFAQINPRLFNQMRQGRVHYSDHIDLHGMYVNEALNYLRDAIDMRRNRQIVCWQIIHGKGKRSPHYDRAPLKHAVIELLLNHPAVAAISTIIDSDGASGAVAIALLPGSG